MAMHYVLSRLEAIDEIDPNGFAVAVVVAHHVSIDGRACMAGRARMAKLCGKTERSVTRGIAWCCDQKILAAVQERDRDRTFKGQQYSLIGYAQWVEKATELAREKPRDIMSPGSEKEAQIEGQSEGQSEGHNVPLTSIEPDQEPEIERERESEPEDQKKVQADGWALLKDWPNFAGMPKEPAMKVWLALPAEERAEASRKFPAWLALLKAQHKSHVPAPSTYLGQKLFREVPEPSEAKPEAFEGKPFGKLWQAVRLKLLLSPPTGMIPDLTWSQRAMVDNGKADEAELRREKRMRNGWPKVNALHDAASFGKSITVAPTFEPLAALMVQVRVGSEEYEAWRVEHQLRGWPWLPDPGKQEWVYFPAGGPVEGLANFEQALRGNDADGSAQAAE